MFFKSFTTSAVVAFVAVIVASAAILPGHGAGEGRTVEFTTVSPSTTAPAAPLGVLDVAMAYAGEHGLTDCVDPAHARLDDVILTVPSDPLGGKVITPVDFDEALESGTHERWNVLACRAAEPAS